MNYGWIGMMDPEFYFGVGLGVIKELHAMG